MTENTHKYALVNGIRMHWVERGSGPLVILCHGFPESWYSWRHQLLALAEAGYRVVAPDQRGYGETGRPESIDAYDLCHLTGDIVGLVEALGETRAAIVGHDWGSAVAWTCALVRPDIFTSVCLMSVPYLPGLFGGPKPTDGMKAMVGDTLNFYQLYFQEPGKAESELEPDLRSTLLGFYYSASGDAPPEHRWRAVFARSEHLRDSFTVPAAPPSWLSEEDLDIFTKQFQASGLRGPINWYRNMDRSVELLAFLKNARISQPSLFIAGALDGVITMYRAAYDGLEASMPGLTRKTLIPGAGHWVQQERAAEVNAQLIEFLGARRSASAT